MQYEGSLSLHSDTSKAGKTGRLMRLWVITANTLESLGSPADCAFFCSCALKYPLVTPGPIFVHTDRHWTSLAGQELAVLPLMSGLFSCLYIHSFAVTFMFFHLLSQHQLLTLKGKMTWCLKESRSLFSLGTAEMEGQLVGMLIRR